MDDFDMQSSIAQVEDTLGKIEPLINKLTSKTLNERIITAGSNSRASKQRTVELINNYGSILSSLLVSYSDLIGVENYKDTELNTEVEKVREYVDRLDKHVGKKQKNEMAAKKLLENVFASSAISSNTPSISSGSNDSSHNRSSYPEDATKSRSKKLEDSSRVSKSGKKKKKNNKKAKKTD